MTSTTRLWARARHRTFKPLYAGLSPEQQQMANQLVGARHHWHRRA
ncbi:MAG: hypothetical protein WCB44_26600 [Stellaceae bacterium]